MLQRAFHRHIDTADRKHADRASRSVNHMDVLRQDIRETPAGEHMRVTAAELHETVLTVRIHRGGELRRNTLGLFGIAVFSDELHAAAPAAAAERAPDWATSARTLSVASACASSIF